MQDTDENQSIRRRQPRGREAEWVPRRSRQDRARSEPEQEAGVKATSPRTGTGCEAGDADELAPHSEVRDSLPQVKHGVVPVKLTRLLGETCPAGIAAGAQRAVAGNGGGQRAGVSRGRSSTGNEPGVGHQAPAPNGPEGLTHARRTKLIGIAETAATFPLELVLAPALQRERPQAAEKDCGQGELGIAFNYPSPTMASAVT